jgi:hypothetical protein
MESVTPEEFWDIVQKNSTVLPQEIFYRLYHDDTGNVLFYSMEHQPGQYIEIDRETFVRSPSNVRVKHGKLVEFRRITTSKLVPTDVGTPCHPNNVCIVVPETQPHQKWSKLTYESD